MKVKLLQMQLKIPQKLQLMEMAKNELNIQPRPNNRIVVMEHIPNRHQSRAVRIIRIKTFIKSHNDSM